MREIVGALIHSTGVNAIRFAKDGAHALEAVASFSPDIIYVDYEMPTMNGLDFIASIRKLKGDIRYTPMIMLSGHSDPLRITAARDRGVTEFVCKPVTAKTVLDRLSHVILNPRPFVSCKTYFGPDRRRRRASAYSGPLRRASDRDQFAEI